MDKKSNLAPWTINFSGTASYPVFKIVYGNGLYFKQGEESEKILYNYISPDRLNNFKILIVASRSSQLTDDIILIGSSNELNLNTTHNQYNRNANIKVVYIDYSVSCEIDSSRPSCKGEFKIIDIKDLKVAAK